MHIRFKQLIVWIMIGFVMISSCFVLSVKADPCAILKVSLPAGTYVGYNSDPWLSECWLLNLTGATQTFTVRINNTSASLNSYDTRLVIALNNEGYSNLVSLIVNGTNVPKSAFKWGNPKPYNLWNWPSGDVYKTWFNDTCVNVGLISRKGYKTVVVSVTFSDALGVRMHFDAYGKSVSYNPPSAGYITHNSIGQDSTVILRRGAPPPQPPIADFFFNPYYPEIGQTVTFNASKSYDPDGYIVSYAWNFGDGTPIVVKSDPITTHIYTNYGDFTVKLKVTDNNGLTGEKILPLRVTKHPIASFTFSPPDPIMHELVTFDASSSTPNGGVLVSYAWDFGDGNKTVTSHPIITHAYATYGTYSVTLNVTDSEGKWDTQTQFITVENAPIADFWWSPYYPQRGELVTFDASSSTSNGGILISYAWNFGDGTPIVVESDPITTHTFAAKGDYTVTLNITDSEGRWNTTSRIVSVVARRYFLTVKTDPIGVTTIPGEGWYNENTNVDLTAPDTVAVSTGVRYKFTYWDVDSTPKLGNPITVTINANHTATAHYILQYYLDVISPYGTTGGKGWYNASATAYATLDTGIVNQGNGTRRVFTHWSGDASGNNYAQSNPILMNGPRTAVANWKKQYYLTVSSPYGSPTPTTGWYDAGSSITSSVTSPWNGPTGTRYVCIGWIGTGSVPPSGSGTSVSFTLNVTSTITWNWKTQYLLTVLTDPSGLTPAPTRNPLGESGPTNSWWYDSSVSVTLTAQNIAGYTFDKWKVDAVFRNPGENPITVSMNAPRTATAYYKVIPPSLSVSISPMTKTIYLGESVIFTSTVTGGTPPYNYQWYLGSSPVPGAKSNSWTFTPSATGVYHVYLNVTDSLGNIAISPTAKITVLSQQPVGGYSISFEKQSPTSQIVACIAIAALFGMAITLPKRKRK